MAKVTREDLLKAKAYNYGSKIFSYADMLANNVGVVIGDEIPENEVFEAPEEFLNEVFTEDGRTIEVEEYELYIATRFEGDTEISYFALDEAE